MSDASRVLFVSATGRLGGAERSLLELLKALPADRVEPHLACPSDGPLPDLARGAGVKTHEVGLRRYRRTLHPFLLAGQVKALFLSSSRIAGLCESEGIRIVHANTDSAALVAWDVCRTGRLPFVWHCRDTRPLGRVGRLLGTRAARVIAISRMVFDHLSAQQVPREKLRLVLNGIDLSRFGLSAAEQAGAAAPGEVCGAGGTKAAAVAGKGAGAVETGSDDMIRARAEVRAELGIPQDAALLTSVGMFVPWKRHEDFLAMIHVLRKRRCGVRGLLAGDDLFEENEEYFAMLRKTAAGLDLGEAVAFTGYRDDIPRLLAASDVFVSASDGEPFGRAVVEAMAAGLPVVATASGAKSELVEDGATGFLVPRGSIGAMASACERLLDDAGLRRRMGERGRERARESFDIRRTAGEIEAIYREILSARPGAAHP